MKKLHLAVLSIFAGIGFVSSLAWIYNSLSPLGASVFESILEGVIIGASIGALISVGALLGVAIAFWEMFKPKSKADID